MQTIGVIADTHIPDRAQQLPQVALDVFAEAQVDAILHAGDISLRHVLKQLGQIAPVHAVRGNRDLLITGLPLHRTLQFEGVTVGLTHGHGSWRAYLGDKLRYLIFGPDSFHIYEQRALRAFPDVDIVVFGHNHTPLNDQRDQRLLFNPGSATRPNPWLGSIPPSVGLLHIDGPEFKAEIVSLDNV